MLLISLVASNTNFEDDDEDFDDDDDVPKAPYTFSKPVDDDDDEDFADEADINFGVE